MLFDDIEYNRLTSARPWVESAQPPPLKETIIKTVEFPEEDESAGDVLVGFFGPGVHDVVATAAMSVLLVYLAGSSVSVLENTLVEKEQLASSILTSWDARPNCIIWLQPTSVATEKLADVEKRLFEVLRDVASKPLDMAYMRDCIERELRQLIYQAESSGEYFSSNVINDFLFGQRDGSSLRDLKSLREYDVILTWTDDQWRDFLRTYISDAHHISILGKPSKKMAERLKTEELARLAKRKEELGESGLEKLREKLELAKAKNDAPIPNELLQKWPVPGTESIHFIKSIPARSGLARSLGPPQNAIQNLLDAGSETDLFIQYEHVPSNFVTINVLMGTAHIPLQYRPLLTLFMDNFFNSPAMYNGHRVEFEQIVTELEKDTVSYTMCGGSRIGDSEGVMIQFQIESKKYEKAIEWIRGLMFDTIFDETRLKAAVVKILADIPEAKRSGSSMLYAVDGMIHLAPESIVKARNTLVKSTVYKQVKKQLETEPEAIIKMMQSVRESLFRFDNMRVLVIGDITRLDNPAKPWDKLTTELKVSESVNPIVPTWKLLSPEGQSPGGIGATIVPMSTIDSSYLISSAKGPTSYLDPQLPALMVAVSYLDAVEGPLWAAVRGTGLAYGTGFSRDVDGGFMQFRVYRSPDAHKAFSASKAIVESYIDGSAPFEDHALEGAVSGIVVMMADEQPSMATAATVNFQNSVIRRLDPDYNSQILKKVRDVGVEDIKKAMRDWLLPTFVAGTANLVVTCAEVMKDVSCSLRRILAR